jgi:hypothetical protein
MILGLIAYSHKSKDKNVDAGWMISSVWALFPESYDEFGKKLCMKGRFLFWGATFSFLIWFIIK